MTQSQVWAEVFQAMFAGPVWCGHCGVVTVCCGHRVVWSLCAVVTAWCGHRVVWPLRGVVARTRQHACCISQSCSEIPRSDMDDRSQKHPIFSTHLFLNPLWSLNVQKLFIVAKLSKPRIWLGNPILGHNQQLKRGKQGMDWENNPELIKFSGYNVMATKPITFLEETGLILKLKAQCLLSPLKTTCLDVNKTKHK